MGSADPQPVTARGRRQPDDAARWGSGFGMGYKKDLRLLQHSSGNARH